MAAKGYFSDKLSFPKHFTTKFCIVQQRKLFFVRLGAKNTHHDLTIADNVGIIVGRLEEIGEKCVHVEQNVCVKRCTNACPPPQKRENLQAYFIAV